MTICLTVFLLAAIWPISPEQYNDHDGGYSHTQEDSHYRADNDAYRSGGGGSWGGSNYQSLAVVTPRVGLLSSNLKVERSKGFF